VIEHERAPIDSLAFIFYRNQDKSMIFVACRGAAALVTLAILRAIIVGVLLYPLRVTMRSHAHPRELKPFLVDVTVDPSSREVGLC